MQKYETLDIDVIFFEAEEVITTSPGNSNSGNIDTPVDDF